MRWLAGLSLAKAIRIALAWPASLAGVVAVLLAIYFAKTRDGWVVYYPVSSGFPGPTWLAVTLAVLVIAFGPSLVFLVLWRLAHGSVHSAN